MLLTKVISIASDLLNDAPTIPREATMPPNNTVTFGVLRRSKTGATIVPTPTMAKQDAGIHDAIA